MLIIYYKIAMACITVLAHGNYFDLSMCPFAKEKKKDIENAVTSTSVTFDM